MTSRGRRRLWRGTGRGLAAAGAQVVLADLDGEQAEQHAKALRAQGRQAIGVVDVADQDAADLGWRTHDEFGGVDILINNAALMKEIPMRSILDLPLDWWERVMKVNVMGALVCSHTMMPSMLERGGGRIINQVSGARSSPAASTASASWRWSASPRAWPPSSVAGGST